MKKILVILSIVVCAGSQAQTLDRQVIASSGDYFTDGNYSLSWTLGEIMTETFSSADNHLTQGFQQPDLLTVSIKEQIPALFSVSVFPNPAIDYVQVNWSTLIEGKVNIEMYDLQGKRVFVADEKADAKQYLIDFTPFAAGEYVLNVGVGSTSSNTYRVTKLK